MSDNILNGDLTGVSAGGDYSTFQPLADLGSGIGANIVGQPYRVYRLSQSGDFLQTSNQINASYPVQREKLTTSDAQGLEAASTQKTFFFSLTADFSLSIVGDCFIQNDPFYGAGATLVNFPTYEFDGFFLGIHPVLQKPIGIRIDRLAQIYRPNLAPDENGYMDTTLENALPLIITAGIAALGAVGQTASFIPVGIMPDKRTGTLIIDKYTAAIPTNTNWAIAVPPLPVASVASGANPFAIREGDRLVTQDGSRFVVMNPYGQYAGLVGWQLTAEREVAPTGGS